MKALLRRDPMGVAAAIIAICAVATPMLAGRGEPTSVAPARPEKTIASPDLARCRGLGADGGADARCQAVWAESRRRFLGVEARP